MSRISTLYPLGYWPHATIYVTTNVITHLNLYWMGLKTINIFQCKNRKEAKGYTLIQKWDYLQLLTNLTSLLFNLGGRLV